MNPNLALKRASGVLKKGVRVQSRANFFSIRIMRFIGSAINVIMRDLSVSGKVQSGIGDESSWLLMVVVNSEGHLVVNNKKPCKSTTCRV